MRPLRESHPASLAAPSAIHCAISVSVNLREVASVHMMGRANDRLAIPPHAVWKFLSLSRFISGGQGEWSVATRSITFSRSHCQSFSRFSRLRIGGAHLKSV